MAETTLKDFGRKLTNIEECLEDDSWKIPALNLGLALKKKRIFEEGKASDGTLLGPYRSNWKQQRERKGRQTGYKDLFFNGDLARSFQLGVSKGEPVIGLTTDLSRLILRGQEEQTGKEISNSTQETLNKVAKSAASGISECLKKYLTN